MDDKLTTKDAITVLRSLQGWLYYSSMNGGASIQREAIDIAIGALKQPEIIRCKDCKWWDRYNDNNGYCVAAKSCTYTSHWDIQIRRMYDGEFYCAHAEPKEEYGEGEDE